MVLVSVCFFFQAEDGIRDDLVTGVQTCALPILRGEGAGPATRPAPSPRMTSLTYSPSPTPSPRRRTACTHSLPIKPRGIRSEERRVGKECRSRGSWDH